jgi:hypothetical protein
MNDNFITWLEEQIKSARHDYMDAIEVQAKDAAQWFLAKLRAYETVRDQFRKWND